MSNAPIPAADIRSIHPTLYILSYVYILYVTLLLAVLAYLIKFIIIDETLSQGTKLTWKAVSNKFNTALLIGNIFIIGYVSFEVSSVFDDAQKTSLSGVGAFFCFAGLQTCLTWYTWLRGEAIFDIVFPRLLPSMRATVFVGTIVLYVPPIVALIGVFVEANAVLTRVSQVTIAVSGLVLSTFDLAVCLSFVMYLRQADTSPQLLNSDNDRFRITCFYGLITSFFEGAAICGYAVALTRASTLEFQIMMVVVRGFVFCGHVTLVLLKVALHRQKEALRASKANSTLLGSQSRRTSNLPSKRMPS
ncbi:hypothetical protein HDU81_003703 [Chytriomyces hyalinus]|nr:hypothetical protein HDU81_003703 [Chytriomyces hyalinus]